MKEFHVSDRIFSIFVVLGEKRKKFTMFRSPYDLWIIIPKLNKHIERILRLDFQSIIGVIEF